MFLLDTNVLSEMRKVQAGQADPHVARWGRDTVESSLFISVITVLELEIGILGMTRRDAVQGNLMNAWLTGRVLPAFEGRILHVNLEIARRCAHHHIPNPRPRRDSLIAATALVHRLTVVTRNVSDFNPTGVAVLNPWEANAQPR
jgi:predicted nucleic acid-binding protein